ncbi:MAG: hypothetical protein HQ559_02540 [Lentisphaerae bacterium]|nr:hypothetical protein [Lentisphaerota bacterium]
MILPSEMSLKQRVGMLLMAPLYEDRLEELLDRFACGSLLTWSGGFGEATRESVQEFCALMNRAQELSLKFKNMPLWLHGQPHEKLAGRKGNWLRRAAEAKVDLTRIEHAASLLGQRWRVLGVHNIPEPTLNVQLYDTCILPECIVSSDPEIVRAYGTAFNRGVLAGRCGTMTQHFPAHGATAQDSHTGFPVVDLPRDELWRDHLLPYQQCFDDGATTLCTAHLACTALDPDPNHMATTSKPILTDFLKGEMGFKGITIADAVEMDGFKKNGPIETVVVDAVNAGCDSICMVGSGSIEPVFNSLFAAAESGHIPAARIDDAIERQLRFIDWLGLNKNAMVDPEFAAKRLGELDNDPEAGLPLTGTEDV